MEANTEALDYLQRTVALRPGDSRAMRNIGFVYRELHQPDAAVDALEKAVTIDPKDWKAHYNLSGAYADAYQKAMSEHATAVMSVKPGTVITAQAFAEQDALTKQMIAKEAYVGKAIEHMREASRLNPDDPTVWHALANVLSQFRQNGRNDAERYEALKRAVALQPDFYPALHDLAITQSETGRYEEALDTCDKIEKAHGNDMHLEWLRAISDFHTKRYEEAVTRYTRVIAGNPQDAALHADLAGVYRAMGRNEDFQRELDTAKALRPEMAQNYDKRFATN
jgi:tetratricopeptide (TPR) repeat protein